MAVVAPSEELRAFLLRIYPATEADDAETLREMFSAGAYSLMVGTDPVEWWTRTDGIEIVIRQSRELGGVRLLPGEPVAHFQGDVGWIADRPRPVLPTGAEVPLRLTAVVAADTPVRAMSLHSVEQWLPVRVDADVA